MSERTRDLAIQRNKVMNATDLQIKNMIIALAETIPGKCHTKEDYKNNICELIDRLFPPTINNK